MQNIDIISRLAALGVAPEAQAQYVTAAVARVIAYSAPLPDTPDQYFFDGAVKPEIAAKLDQYNESIPLDYPLVTELVRKLWTLRFNLLYPGNDRRQWAALDLLANEQFVDLGVLRNDPALHILTNDLLGE